MRICGIINHAARISAASVLAAAAIFISLPAAVKAQPNPVDLELDAAGYTPIIVNNIKPGDSGTKTIELRNTGTKTGYVSIWLSDIVKGEGLNPESETGDTSGEGEMDEYFLMSLEAEGMTTNLDFPAAVKNLPTSATSQAYIDIMPLKAGETKTLDWLWELPYDTGNIVQGDELSFTINYLLREMEITDVSADVTPEGEFINDIVIFTDDNRSNIRINANTIGMTADNKTPSDIWFIEILNEPPPPPANMVSVGQYYDAGPDGTTFDKPLTITLNYNPAAIPDRVSQLQLYIAVWDKTAGTWVPLPNCVVNTATRTISTQITHFSRYTVLAPKPPPLPEPEIPVTEPGETPDEEEEEPALLEVKLLDSETVVEIGKDGTVNDTIILEDREGKFTLEIPGGTRITGVGGEQLGSLSVFFEEITLILPDNTVILTPVYRVVGYNTSGEMVEIGFYPSAILTIRYNPDALPENSFLPYMASYSDEEGLVPLDIPAGHPVEIGISEALITGSALFVVAVETAPPPLPLPAYFTASNLVVTPLQGFVGDPVSIGVTITNNGSLQGTYELYLVIDGIVRSIREVTLNSRSSETFTFEISNLAVGSHQIKIAGLTETVRIDQIIIEPMGPEVNWLILDLSVAAAVIGGLVLWFLLMRRARRSENAENTGDQPLI